MFIYYRQRAAGMHFLQNVSNDSLELDLLQACPICGID